MSKKKTPDELKEQMRRGCRLHSIRTTLGFTQEEFAEGIGESVDYVKRLENGTRGMKIEVLVKISKFYQLSVDYILFGNEESAEDILTPIVDATEKLLFEALKNCRKIKLLN